MPAWPERFAGAPCGPRLRAMSIEDNVDAAHLPGAFLETAAHKVSVERDAASALASRAR